MVTEKIQQMHSKLLPHSPLLGLYFIIKRWMQGRDLNYSDLDWVMVDVLESDSSQAVQEEITTIEILRDKQYQ